MFGISSWKHIVGNDVSEVIFWRRILQNYLWHIYVFFVYFFAELSTKTAEIEPQGFPSIKFLLEGRFMNVVSELKENQKNQKQQAAII